MKHFYLLALGAALSFNTTAQEVQKVTRYVQPEILDDHIYSGPPVEPAKHRSSLAKNEAETITLGSSGNVFSFILGSNNNISYDPATGAIAFIHRENGTTGNLRYDLSTDGGSSWETDLGPLTPGYDSGLAPQVGNGCRFPNGAIWNPEGNTDPNNAFFVGHGPALSDVTGSWGNLFEVSVGLDGENNSEKYTDNTENLESFHPYAMCSTPGAVWSLSTANNNDPQDLERDSINDYFFYLNKGVFNEGDNSFDWAVQEIFSADWLPFDINENDFDDNLVLDYGMAFSMDGQIGYAVVMGAEMDNPDNAPLPAIWKSEDAGDSWERLPYFEFADVEAFQDFMIFDEEVQSQIKPFFTEFDLVVDNEGRLHLFADVVSGAPDTGFAFLALESQGLCHLSVSDGTDWDVHRVAAIINDTEGEIGDVGLGTRPQISISEDGEALFFIWQEDDDEQAIEFPDVTAVGYLLSEDSYSDPKRLTQGTDYEEFAFWGSAAPISIANGECFDYEIPIVFGEPAGTDLDVLQYYYLRFAGFNVDEMSGTVGIASNNDLKLKMFPNPTSDVVRINGLESTMALVEVFDTQARKVLSTQLNSSNPVLQVNQLGSGIYIVNVETNQGRWTNSLVIK